MTDHRLVFSRLSATLSLVSSSWPLRRLCRMPLSWLCEDWYLRK